MLERIMKRMISLDQHATFDIAATGSTCDLGEQLKSPFSSPEIRHRQTGIDRNHADKRDIREIMTFGDHLGSHQNVDLTGSEFRDYFFVCSSFSGCVAVEASDGHRGISLFDDCFQLFCALADIENKLA